MMNDTAVTKRYLVVSDFDQTLSFNDSGVVLSEVVGVPGFHEKVVGLSKINLVQQGAELAYLLRHDPEFRGVRRHRLYSHLTFRAHWIVRLLTLIFGAVPLKTPCSYGPASTALTISMSITMRTPTASLRDFFTLIWAG
jgi:hypothetical protein